MIESSIEELFNSINNSNEYKEYKLIVNTLESNKEVIDLIEEIKKLQKEAVNLEYKNDDRYLEVDKLIKEKDIITIRGKGKFIIDEIACSTKKGNYVIFVKKFA